VLNGVSTLVYAYGNYRQSLAIELATAIPRIILYFILIPIYGPIGGAISFTIGSILAFIISAVIARKIGMSIFWKDLALMIIIPTVIGYLIYTLKINYIVGIIITLIASYLLLLKLHTVTKSDIYDGIDVLPTGISMRMLRLLKKWNRS
jgi:peptidoglycan biosynthesis protein MviN/MurJ (putative lipid II flippase)